MSASSSSPRTAALAQRVTYGSGQLGLRGGYVNDKQSALMVASYATFEARLRRPRSTPSPPPAALRNAPIPPSSPLSSTHSSPHPSSISFGQQTSPTGRITAAASRYAAALDLLTASPSPCISLTLATDFSTARLRHRRRLRRSATGILLSTRFTPSDLWRPLQPHPIPLVTGGHELVHLPLASAADAASAELRVAVVQTKGGASALAVAIVRVTAALEAPPGPPHLVALLAPSGAVVGTLVIRTAVTPPAYLPGRHGGSSSCPPWGLALCVSHAASVARDLRGARVTLQRVCRGGGGSVVAVGCVAATRGGGEPVWCSAELLRHGCGCTGSGGGSSSGDAGHALRLVWWSGRREAVLAGLDLPLEELRMLHARDVLGPLVWRGGRGGVGSRLVIVLDARHTDGKTCLSICLTR